MPFDDIRTASPKDCDLIWERHGNTFVGYWAILCIAALVFACSIVFVNLDLAGGLAYLPFYATPAVVMLLFSLACLKRRPSWRRFWDPLLLLSYSSLLISQTYRLLGCHPEEEAQLLGEEVAKLSSACAALVIQQMDPPLTVSCLITIFTFGTLLRMGKHWHRAVVVLTLVVTVSFRVSILPIQPILLNVLLLGMSGVLASWTLGQQEATDKRLNVYILKSNQRLHEVIAARRHEVETQARLTQERESRLIDTTERAASRRVIAYACHSLRNPVHNISYAFDSIVSEIPKHTALESTINEDVRIMRKALAKMRRLVDDLFRFEEVKGDNTSLSPLPTAVRILVSSAVDAMASHASVPIHMVVDEDVPHTVSLVESKVNEILVQVLSNAARATQRGRIIVRVSIPSLAAARGLRMRSATTQHESTSSLGDSVQRVPPKDLLSAENYLLFDVIDTGCGLKGQPQDRLFQEYQLNTSSKGSSLGLPMVRRIAASIGGSVGICERSPGDEQDLTYGTFTPASPALSSALRRSRRKSDGWQGDGRGSLPELAVIDAAWEASSRYFPDHGHRTQTSASSAPFPASGHTIVSVGGGGGVATATATATATAGVVAPVVDPSATAVGAGAGRDPGTFSTLTEPLATTAHVMHTPSPPDSLADSDHHELSMVASGEMEAFSSLGTRFWLLLPLSMSTTRPSPQRAGPSAHSLNPYETDPDSPPGPLPRVLPTPVRDSAPPGVAGAGHVDMLRTSSSGVSAGSDSTGNAGARGAGTLVPSHPNLAYLRFEDNEGASAQSAEVNSHVVVSRGRPPTIPGPQQRDLSDLKVCFCDDERLNRRIGQRFLKKAGVGTVDVFSDGDEVIPAVEAGNYDVYLLDVVMKRMSGIQCTRRLREMGVEAPIVAVTANGDSHYRREMAMAGVSLLVTKPYDAIDLERAVRLVVGRGRPGDPPPRQPDSVSGTGAVWELSVDLFQQPLSVAGSDVGSER